MEAPTTDETREWVVQVDYSGDEAEADDLDGALLAAKTLQAEHRDRGFAKSPVRVYRRGTLDRIVY